MRSEKLETVLFKLHNSVCITNGTVIKTCNPFWELSLFKQHSGDAVVKTMYIPQFQFNLQSAFYILEAAI